MNKVSVQSLNECFNVSGEDFIWIDDDYEQPFYNQPWNKGKSGLFKHTEESKSKIPGRPGGWKHTEDVKSLMSEQRRGEKNAFYGKTFTEESKKRITARHRKWYRFVSPKGEVWEEFTTLREFAKKIGKDRTTIQRSKNWQITEL